MIETLSRKNSRENLIAKFVFVTGFRLALSNSTVCNYYVIPQITVSLCINTLSPATPF